MGLVIVKATTLGVQARPPSNVIVLVFGPAAVLEFKRTSLQIPAALSTSVPTPPVLGSSDVVKGVPLPWIVKPPVKVLLGLVI
jgi:hypothetical protein